jgi:hypothetical protein
LNISFFDNYKMNHVYMKFIFLFLLLTTLLSAQSDRVFLTWDLSKPASFPGGLEENSCQHIAKLVFSKSPLPASMLWSDIRCDTIFEPVGVDQPAVYKFGPKSIEELVVLHWPQYKSDIPPGKEILIRILVPENGNVRYMELISGVGAEVDKKALAVLKRASDYWTPAYKDGRPVSSWSVVRIGR